MYTEPMRKIKLLSKIQLHICALILLLLAGCGNGKDPSVSKEVESTTAESTEGIEMQQGTEIPSGEEVQSVQNMDDREQVGEMELYLLVQWNTEEKKLRLYRYSTGMEYEYRYGESTLFRDKFGDYANESVFIPGSIVHLGGIDSEGNLIRVQMAKEVWTYEDISRYSINENRGIFEIVDTRYQWKEDIYVFSNEQRITLGDISDGDKISVIGYGKTILSVAITESYGTLELSNTDLFEGGLLQLGTKVYKKITENMTLDVPEGTYILSVANNGWGDSKEITISRGEITSVDLDTLKGEGPSYCKAYFKIDVPEAILSIDGKEVDHYMLQKIVYGKHKITVEAEGYDTWSRYLYVNSGEATIEIELEEEEEETSESTSEENTESEENEEDSQSESEKREEEKEEALEEYYTTLTDMIGSMT